MDSWRWTVCPTTSVTDSAIFLKVQCCTKVIWFSPLITPTELFMLAQGGFPWYSGYGNRKDNIFLHMVSFEIHCHLGFCLTSTNWPLNRYTWSYIKPSLKCEKIENVNVCNGWLCQIAPLVLWNDKCIHTTSKHGISQTL
jgi:hypothetical protein